MWEGSFGGHLVQPIPKEGPAPRSQQIGQSCTRWAFSARDGDYTASWGSSSFRDHSNGEKLSLSSSVGFPLLSPVFVASCPFPVLHREELDTITSL